VRALRESRLAPYNINCFFIDFAIITALSCAAFLPKQGTVIFATC
jgi:hypothetical protein